LCIVDLSIDNIAHSLPIDFLPLQLPAMVKYPHNNEDPVPSSSAAVPDAAVVSDNPVVAAAQKAKSAVKKHVARPGMENRPSVRLMSKPSYSPASQANRPVQRSHDVVPEERAREEESLGWRSMFRKKNVDSDVDEKDSRPIGMQELGQSGRKRVMVPRRVAEELAPHIAAHQDGNEDPQALAEHFATHADEYLEAEKQNTSVFQRTTERAGGVIRSLFNRGKRSNDDEFSSTIPVYDLDEYDSDMVDLLDVIGTYT
jgi:hypothetical protein